MSALLVPLSLVPRKSDPSVVLALRLLLAQAEAGQLLGLAYITLQPDAKYSGDLVGNALQHPIMALGLATALEERIAALLR